MTLLYFLTLFSLVPALGMLLARGDRTRDAVGLIGTDARPPKTGISWREKREKPNGTYQGGSGNWCIWLALETRATADKQDLGTQTGRHTGN